VQGDAREVIGVVRVPLIPSIISDGRACGIELENALIRGLERDDIKGKPTRLGPVNTSLENGCVASVTVNANPSGTRAGSGRCWYSEGSSHASVA
jgi:hypothetical protein